MSSNMIQRLALVLAILPVVYGRNVYVMPANNGVSREVSIFAADPFARIGSVQAATDAYKAISLPNGTKTYIVGRGSANTVTVVNNSTLQVAATINVPGGSTEAAISPDGRRLVLAGNGVATLTVIDTGTDAIQQAVNLPGVGVSLAMAFDSSKVYTLVPSATAVASVDLFSYSVATVALPTQTELVCGVALSPNGYLYASAPNRLYEIDPRTFTVNLDTSSLYLGVGGVPQFTPDGLRAVLPIGNPSAAQSSATVIELRRSNLVGSSINLQGLRLDRLQVISASTAIAYSQGGSSLYTLTLTAPYNGTATPYNGLPTNALTSLAVTNEVVSAAYTFTSQGNTLYRITNATGAVTSQALAENSGPVSFTGPSSTLPVTQLIAVNGIQLASPLNVLAPMVIRAVDTNGFGVSGVPINFSSANIYNVAPSPSSVITNAQGYAVSNVTNPGLQPINFTVLAATASQITQIFSFVISNTGSSGGGGGGGNGITGAIEIWDGNGLFVKSGLPGSEMVVRVSDSTQKPVAGATVTWAITSSGGGSLVNSTSVSNDKGLATNTFIAKILIGAQQSYEGATITATTGVGTVTFGAVQIPLFVESAFPGLNVRAANEPQVTQLVPAEFTQPEITGPLGGTVKGAFQFRILTTTGPFLYVPIPGVGVQASTGLTPEEGPTVSCDPNAVSNADGIVTCDLRFSKDSKIGFAENLIIRVGGLREFRFTARMTVGEPAKLEKVKNERGDDPDNQVGRAGTDLPRQLLARITDLVGNLTTGGQVRWEVLSGSATLIGTVSRADARGIVSTGVRLGNTPGQVRIRVSVPSVPSISPLDFNATVDAQVSELRKISGDNQSATVNTPFDQPLVVRIIDGQQRPVQGAVIAFSANGDVQVASSATTDSNGQASVSVRAGNTPNVYSVSASIGGFTQTFSLTVRALGPTFTSITNNASGRADASVAPCALVNINGLNIAPNLQGTRVGGQIGRLPLTLEGVTVRFNGITAPISSVTGGGSRGDVVVVQAPCDLLPGSANVDLTSSTLAPASTTVRVTPVAPGIYQEADSNGNLKAVVLRPNGVATATNPAEAGETVTIIATGLGLVSPGTATNSPGTGNQVALADVVIGLNNEGITASSTEYAPGFVGIYYIGFAIPMNTTRGVNRPIVIAASGADGNIVFSAASVMDIR